MFREACPSTTWLMVILELPSVGWVKLWRICTFVSSPRFLVWLLLFTGCLQISLRSVEVLSSWESQKIVPVFERPTLNCSLRQEGQETTLASILRSEGLPVRTIDVFPETMMATHLVWTHLYLLNISRQMLKQKAGYNKSKPSSSQYKDNLEFHTKGLCFQSNKV